MNHRGGRAVSLIGTVAYQNCLLLLGLWRQMMEQIGADAFEHAAGAKRNHAGPRKVSILCVFGVIKAVRSTIINSLSHLGCLFSQTL